MLRKCLKEYSSGIQTSSNCCSVFGCRRLTRISKFFHKFLIGFRSVHLKGQLRTLILFFFSHAVTDLLLCSLICWKENQRPNLILKAPTLRFSFNIVILFSAFIVLLIQTCFHSHWNKSNPITWCYHLLARLLGRPSLEGQLRLSFVKSSSHH